MKPNSHTSGSTGTDDLSTQNMKFVICITILVAVACGQEVDDQPPECNEVFVREFEKAKTICFGDKEKDNVQAEALLGQSAWIESPPKHLRRKREDDVKNCKKEWMNDPEKLEKMNDKIVCMEKELATTPMYAYINLQCEEEIEKIEDEEVNKRHAKIVCMIGHLETRCPNELGGKGGGRGRH